MKVVIYKRVNGFLGYTLRGIRTDIRDEQNLHAAKTLKTMFINKRRQL